MGFRYTASISLLLLLSAVFRVDATAQTADLRVRLLDQHLVDDVTITAEVPLKVYAGAADNVLLTVPPETPLHVNRRGDELRAAANGSSIFALGLGIRAAEQEMISVRSNRLEAVRAYTGHLTIKPERQSLSSLQLVNHVPLEDYVASVVASEYGFEDLEGAKAMAVLVRTYALRNKFGDAYDHVDHVMSQQYDGANAITPTSLEATQATQGQVLVHADSLIEAVYFSASGGHTANNEDVWDARPLPYLRGRPDPTGTASPHQSWEATLNRQALLQALSRHVGAPVRGFVIGDRSSEGRVRTIELLTGTNRRPMQANAFRLLANQHAAGHGIKSTWFDARREGNRYVFTGRGFGHGVGLSQYGARGLSAQGYPYAEILDYYFTDVRLASIDELSLPVAPWQPPTLAEAPVQAEEPAEEPAADEPRKQRSRRIGW